MHTLPKNKFSNEKDLKKIALNMREAIVYAIENVNHVGPDLDTFPLGSCEITSVMIGLYLTEIGEADLTLAKGERVFGRDEKTEHHIWLIVNNEYIVDITADQFEDCNLPVIVTKKSNFHCTFEPIEKRELNDSYLDGFGDEGYRDFFNLVLSKLSQ